MSADMCLEDHDEGAVTFCTARVVKESHDWRQLCQQVCQSSGALSACFAFFSNEQAAPLLVMGRHWPQLPAWTTADYQAVLRDNTFYCAISGPHLHLNSYFAVPILRGSLRGLLLLNYPDKAESLTHAQCQLLDTLATQGALLWQEKLWHDKPWQEWLEQEQNVLSYQTEDDSSRGLFRRLKSLFHNVPIPVNAFNAQGRCILWNQACEQAFGWSRAEIKQHSSPLTLFYPEADERARVVDALNTSNNSIFEEWQPYNRAGRRLTILWAHISLPNGGILCVGHDISEQADIEHQQRLAANVFESSYDGIVISDSDHRITHINPAFTRITGFTAEDVIGSNPYQSNHLVFESEIYTTLREQLKTQDYWQGELKGRRKSDEPCVLRLAITVVKDDVGKSLSHVTLLSDVTHLKQYEANLKHQAFHDALTGIPNRLLFGELLDRAISTSERNRSQLAICYLDLDGFKAVNDNFGHAAGDKLLIEISRRLSTVTRGCDAVARLGGDEFALLFSGLQSSQEYESILKRVQKVIRQPVMLDERVVTISASIGVALYPQDADQAELLLRFADQAMYQAKAQGKNVYAFFDAALHQ